MRIWPWSRFARLEDEIETVLDAYEQEHRQRLDTALALGRCQRELGDLKGRLSVISPTQMVYGAAMRGAQETDIAGVVITIKSPPTVRCSMPWERVSDDKVWRLRRWQTYLTASRKLREAVNDAFAGVRQADAIRTTEGWR